MHKIMIQGTAEGFPFESWVADHYDLYLARYEHEAFQVVVVPDTALTNVTVVIGTLAPQDGQGPFTGEVQVGLVGYVDVAENPIDVIDYPAYLSDYHGWWPDALLTFQQTCDINANDRVPFWVDVFTHADTPPGDYVATITVTADGCDPVNLQLNVHVWDFELPVSSSLDTAFSCQTTHAVPLYGVDWTETPGGMHYKMFDIMLEHRLNVTELYRTSSPTPFSWIQYWESKGATSFCLGKVPAILNDPGKKATLDTLVADLRAAGLLDMAYVYGFDEVGPDKFETICIKFGQVHSDYPGLRTMTTARDYTFGLSTDPDTSCLRSVVDIWVPPVDYRYDMAAGEVLRTEGKDMWWYTCCWPRYPYPNWFVECPSIEARLLLGAMSYKFKAGGYLYWAVARWLNEDGVSNTSPITSGPYTSWDPRTFYHSKTGTWASGDGCLLLPGPTDFIPTIRLENVRDGLEDYEYLWLLADLVNTIAPGSTPEEIAFVADANALLAVPGSVVNSLTSFTRDPGDLYSFRQQVADKILQGTALVEGVIPGDLDDDGDVDMTDFGMFQVCLSGPYSVLPNCGESDFNSSGKVDSDDLNIFLQCLSGESIPADPDCAE